MLGEIHWQNTKQKTNIRPPLHKKVKGWLLLSFLPALPLVHQECRLGHFRSCSVWYLKCDSGAGWPWYRPTNKGKILTLISTYNQRQNTDLDIDLQTKAKYWPWYQPTTKGKILTLILTYNQRQNTDLDIDLQTKAKYWPWYWPTIKGKILTLISTYKQRQNNLQTSWLIFQTKKKTESIGIMSHWEVTENLLTRWSETLL